MLFEPKEKTGFFLTRVSGGEYRECDFSLVKIMEDDLKLLATLHERFMKMKEDLDGTMTPYSVCFWHYPVIWLKDDCSVKYELHELLDANTCDDYLEISPIDPDKDLADDYEVSSDCDQLVIMKDEFYWEAIVKHCDQRLASATFKFKDFGVT